MSFGGDLSVSMENLKKSRPALSTVSSEQSAGLLWCHG
jgi:hypothetical protein